MMVRFTNQEFKEKYELYAQMIMNISYGYTKNKLDSEDIIQNVFVKFLKCRKEFKSLEDEKYWLIRVTINECKNFLKNSYNTKVLLDEKVVLNTKVEEDDKTPLMFDYVKKLPDKYKKPIILHYYNSLPIKEVSEILKISISSVKKQLERGRKILKEMMEDVYEIR